MRDKIISLILGIFLGAFLMYLYFIIWGESSNNLPINSMQNSFEQNISDEQLQRISDRTGIGVEDIKKRLESGESLKDITGGFGRGNTGEGNMGSGTLNQ